MGALFEQALLACALTLVLERLLRAPVVARAKPEWPLGRRAAQWALLLALSWHVLGWCWALPAPPAWELPAPLTWPQVARRAAADAALAVAALASLGAEGAETVSLGLTAGPQLGLMLGALGAGAVVWTRVFAVWRLLGWFSGTFFAAVLPWGLPAVAIVVAAALHLSDLRPHRNAVALAAMAAWILPGLVATAALERGYGLGPASLSAEAGLPEPARAERVSLAWLYPGAGRSVRFEEKQAVAAGVEASPESLDRLRAYLLRRDYDGVFARQALTALRQGWLFWWEADRALDAAALHREGRAAPDYVSALKLLRGGPMTEERFRKLEELGEAAAPRKEGFEDVNTSQLIFEGFASAYARFGDEESARKWLLRVDNLWPIYEKKIEVSPLETAHDCRVEGSVLVDGQPSRTVKVGLFYVASSTGTAGALSQSAYPDEGGRFRFSSLAPGTYYLGLMGLPAEVRGRVLNPPGFVEPTAEKPVVRLDPIRVER